MIFNERKYISNLLSSERIKVGDSTKISISIIEVFTREQPASASVQIMYGEGRSKTQLVDFTLMDGSAPIFTYTSDFAGITASTQGTLNIKIVDSEGDNVLLQDSINVEFEV